jgi:hypothetical protein
MAFSAPASQLSSEDGDETPAGHPTAPAASPLEATDSIQPALAALAAPASLLLLLLPPSPLQVEHCAKAAPDAEPPRRANSASASASAASPKPSTAPTAADPAAAAAPARPPTADAARAEALACGEAAGGLAHIQSQRPPGREIDATAADWVIVSRPPYL